MIALHKLRDLDLAAVPAAGRPRHVSAASGLVRVQSNLYIVADDELHLGVFPVADGAPGQLIRLFEGELPAPKAARKKQKPDLEALTFLPPDKDYPHGALLALGSGSTSNRYRTVCLGLDAHGAVAGAPSIADYSSIFALLAGEFPALNIEGALVHSGELRLFQRGNKTDRRNAIIRFPLAPMRDAFRSGRADVIAPLAVNFADLGTIDGIPYSFTDATALPDGRMIFTAVAEDTPDAYDDGPCVAAAIGLMDSDGLVGSLRRLDQPHKIEGVDARIDGGIIKLLLVTDADDAEIPASLFAAAMDE